VSLIVPEVWSRMSAEERDPKFLVANRPGKVATLITPAKRCSRAGSAGASTRVRANFFGRVFNHPHAVFTEAMSSRTAGQDIFADGMDNIIATQKRVAKMYFDDGQHRAGRARRCSAATHHAP